MIREVIVIIRNIYKQAFVKTSSDFRHITSSRPDVIVKSTTNRQETESNVVKTLRDSALKIEFMCLTAEVGRLRY